MVGEWEGESLGEGGVALSVFLHPFCLFCIVSQKFRDAGQFYRTLLPLSGVSQTAQYVFLYVNHTFFFMEGCFIVTHTVSYAVATWSALHILYWLSPLHFTAIMQVLCV